VLALCCLQFSILALLVRSATEAVQSTAEEDKNNFVQRAFDIARTEGLWADARKQWIQNWREVDGKHFLCVNHPIP
jgi:hypothetical protein